MKELTDSKTGKKSFQLLNEAVNEVLSSTKPNKGLRDSK